MVRKQNEKMVEKKNDFLTNFESSTFKKRDFKKKLIKF